MRRVILARPEGPRNLGSVLRAAANFGPAEVWVTAPQRPSLLVHPEFEQMAHGVAGWRDRVTVVETLEEALADCTHAVGFTGRAKDHRQVYDWRELREETAARSADPDERVALVFGTEIHGLVENEVELMQQLARFPVESEHRSINLAAAATVALYDTYLPSAPTARSRRGYPVTGHARSYLRAHVAETLRAAAGSEQIAAEIDASCDRLFARAELDTRDARAWHAVMRALGNKKSPLDYGLGPVPDAARDGD